MHRLRIPLLLLMVVCAPVHAVSISVDPAGQVLIFPFYLTGGGFQTLLEIRNKDSEQGRAVRVVAKDPINGRPNVSLNVYLGPNDSWSTAIYDPSNADTPEEADASLVRWVDQSCTFPALDQIPQTGLALSDQFHGENLDALITSNRLSTGFIEIYEMGVIEATLATDCNAIAERWAGGVWSGGSTNDLQNDDVASPNGGLEGYAVVVDVTMGQSFHFEALVLDDFSNQAMHTHPDEPRHPSLIDVSPAESRILESVEFANRTIQVERVSTWTEDPVNAIDALLMTVATRSDFSSDPDVDAIPSVIVNLPTRAYHTDAEGFYGNNRRLAPFLVTVPTQSGETLRDNLVDINVLDRDGAKFALTSNPGSMNCDLVNGSLTRVFMVNQFGFDLTCQFTQAEFRVPSNADEGEVNLSFDGELVSDEGHRFKGLPVYGVLLQRLRNQFVPLPGNNLGIANYGWARIMKSDRSITDPE